jgi:TetR/AcrR family transcriptional repressor of mexJK operon
VGRPKDLIKRSEILDAARDLFFAQGVMPVTLEAIAKKANVSRMTVYAHFGDKKTLFREVIKRQATTLADSLALRPERNQDRGEHKDDWLQQELNAFGTAFVKFLNRPDIKAWNRLRQEEAKNYPDLAKIFSQAASVVLDTLTSRLQSAHDRGELKVSDSPTAARHLIGMLASVDVCSAIGLKEQPTAAMLEKHVIECVNAFLRAYSADEGHPAEDVGRPSVEDRSAVPALSQQASLKARRTQHRG